MVTTYFYWNNNSVLRRLLCISKPYSASTMFVTRGNPTFAELLGKSIYRFTKQIEVYFM